jgi:hypothetical protein
MPPDSVIGRAADAAPATPEAASADEARLGAVTLVDGRARLISKHLAPDVTIDAINVTVDWRKPGAAAIVTGQAQIRGETATIAAWIASPAGLLRGQQSPLSLKIVAPSLSFSVDGGLASVPEWQFGGYIRAATPSLRAILKPVAMPLSRRRVRFFRTCVCISTGMNSKGPWRTRRATRLQFSPVHWQQTGFRYGHFFPAFRLPLGAMANGIVIHLSLGRLARPISICGYRRRICFFRILSLRMLPFR